MLPGSVLRRNEVEERDVLFSELKSDLQQARLRAAIALNREFLLFYWQVGKALRGHHRMHKELAHESSPLVRRFRNFLTVQRVNVEGLEGVEEFAALWTEEEVTKAPLSLLVWDHHRMLIGKMSAAKKQYLQVAEECVARGWSSGLLWQAIFTGNLASSIEARRRKALAFDGPVPPSSALAKQLLKCGANLRFMGWDGAETPVRQRRKKLDGKAASR